MPTPSPPHLRLYELRDLPAMAAIWNEVVAAGRAFPQTEPLTPGEAAAHFAGQTASVVADVDGGLAGLYILHPNNVGRCGHIANAAFAVAAAHRGRGLGELLARHCLALAAERGFTLLQFNAVVATNHGAIALYEKLGFTRLGAIPGGFLLPDGSYADIYPYYIKLG